MPMTPIMMPEQAQAAATSMALSPPSIKVARMRLGVMRCSGFPNQETTINRRME